MTTFREAMKSVAYDWRAKVRTKSVRYVLEAIGAMLFIGGPFWLGVIGTTLGTTILFSYGTFGAYAGVSVFIIGLAGVVAWLMYSIEVSIEWRYR